MTKEEKQFAEDIEALLEAGNKEGLRTYLNQLLNSEIAEVVELFDNEQRRLIFDVLDKPTSAEVLEKVDEATRSELFEILREDEIASIVSELDADVAADVLSEMEEEDVAGVLETMPAEESEEILKLMKYSEDSAGGIMDPVVLTVTEDATVAEAVNKIRDAEIDEDFFTVFVVDRDEHFLGVVRIRLLLTSPANTKIKNLIEPEKIFVRADADQEEVRNIFSKNDLIVVPVLDQNDKLIGCITADRIIEVAEEEAAEDLYAMAGTVPEELDDVSVVRAARIRMTWLFPCMIGTAVTSFVLMFFNNFDHITYIAVVAFVPMIAAISGNAGLQTSTIVVSGLATGHLADLRLRQVFAREVRIAVLVAISCGIIGGIVCSLLIRFRGTVIEHDPLRIVFAFGLAMFSAIMVATTLGLFLPFLFRKIGIDPAISSGPLVTTANDSISVSIYLALAMVITG